MKKPVPERLFNKVRSSHLRFSIRKTVLKKFVIFTGKHLCLSRFFYYRKTPVFESIFLKSGLNFIKKETPQRCFPMNIAKCVASLKLEAFRKQLYHWKFINKRHGRRCFPISMAKFLTNFYLQNTSRRVLLFFGCR